MTTYEFPDYATEITDSDVAAAEAQKSLDTYLARLSTQNTLARRAFHRLLVYILLAVVLILAVWFILPVILGDFMWCQEQWGWHTRALHCTVVESTFVGKYFVPEIIN